MWTKTKIGFCGLIVLWLVTQVAVPAFHQHLDSASSSSTSTQWQDRHDDGHECYICHLNYSPVDLQPSHGELVPVLEDHSSIASSSVVPPTNTVAIPPVRAPPSV